MTLNDLERHNSPYSALVDRIFIAMQANYVTMVENRPIMFRRISSCGYILVRTDTRSSCMVSLRQLSFLLKVNCCKRYVSRCIASAVYCDYSGEGDSTAV